MLLSDLSFQYSVLAGQFLPRWLEHLTSLWLAASERGRLSDKF
jgi:hypothetical protein